MGYVGCTGTDISRPLVRGMRPAGRETAGWACGRAKLSMEASLIRFLIFCKGLSGKRPVIAPSAAAPASIGLSVIQCFKVLFDGQIGIGCEDLEIAATNAFSPPLAHFGDRLASDKAAELRTETAVPANG